MREDPQEDRRADRRGEGWKARAACRGSTLDFFSLESEDVAAALGCCQNCPVRSPCLDVALANQEAHGVWGGTTEQERRRIFRRRGRRVDAA